MRISFHGGTGETTGAAHLLEAGGAKILIDCGMFQGCDECSDLNHEPFPFAPASLDALVVTHGHIDHVGRIPRLMHEGFRGPIYSTQATKDLALPLLEDALGLAEREGKKLYDKEDIEHAMRVWKGISYHQEVVVKDVRIRLLNAGHILGSAMVDLTAEGKRFLFTGDLGNDPSILLPPHEAISGINFLIIESTYGNRVHEPAEERVLNLERAIEDTAFRKGTLMIPAFATERTQDILFLLNEMIHFKRVPPLPVFVDSPLAIKITEVFERHPELYKKEIFNLLKQHPHLFRFKSLYVAETVEESKKINSVPAPKVVIAGSGMMTGGRILHHAARYLPDEKSILLVVGYQAAGSLGRRLVDGATEIKIFHERVAVNAEIRQIKGFSAHADGPQLFSFVVSLRDTLEHVFVVQGEDAQALHLRQEVRDRLGITADTPSLHQSFTL